MSFNEDLPKPKANPHEIGQDLSMLSVFELDERIGLLKVELSRLEVARAAKEASKSAADSFFKKG